MGADTHASAPGNEGKPTPENSTLFQTFEWHVPADGKHYLRLAKQVPDLRAWGIDNFWLPPGCKGATADDNGYSIYDMYDIGEFNQKGTVRTKWGTREELEALCKTAREHGIGLCWDTVFNHRMAADRVEQCPATEVEDEDRTREAGETGTIGAWTGFDYKGRGGAYSKMKYGWQHFSGVDWDENTKRKAIFKLMREEGETSYPRGGDDVDDEYGNYDFLMAADLDHANPEVRQDMMAWGEWIASALPITGMRFDAARHFSREFLELFMRHLREKFPDRNWYFVGEFWKYNVDDLCAYLDRMGDCECSLFDTLMAGNWGEYSKKADKGGADLRTVFDGTLAAATPTRTMTLVSNHDTQPGQVMDTPISAWFKPLAYSLVLLREGGYPCVFYGDVYGISGDEPSPPLADNILLKLVLARRLFAYGKEQEYSFAPSGGAPDDGHCIGWVRPGTWDKPAGCAVVMSCSKERRARGRMDVGRAHAGETWVDVLQTDGERAKVVVGDDGFGEFACKPRSLAVFVNKGVKGVEKFKESFDNDIYGRKSG